MEKQSKYNKGKPTRDKGHETKQRVFGLLRNLGPGILFSLVYPLVVYYGLRAVGINTFFSLLIGAIPIGGFHVFQFIKQRKIDRLGLFMLAILGLSVGLAFMTGSARFMLAKSGFFTAIIAGGFFLSLLFKRPIVFTIATCLLQRMKVSKGHLNELWSKLPQFRRVWRVSTIIWGVGTLLNSVIILGMAYLLPVDVVPLLNMVVNLLIFVAMQIITNTYYKKQGIWKWVFHKEAAQWEVSLNGDADYPHGTRKKSNP